MGGWDVVGGCGRCWAVRDVVGVFEMLWVCGRRYGGV